MMQKFCGLGFSDDLDTFKPKSVLFSFPFPVSVCMSGCEV